MGRRLNTEQKRDDSTLKRYIELFFMVAVMALLTMGIQVGLRLVSTTDFWWRYASFVVIFYVLLGCILHFFTFVKHRRVKRKIQKWLEQIRSNHFLSHNFVLIFSNSSAKAGREGYLSINSLIHFLAVSVLPNSA